jgi:hypothetical protein
MDFNYLPPSQTAFLGFPQNTILYVRWRTERNERKGDKYRQEVGRVCRCSSGLEKKEKQNEQN